MASPVARMTPDRVLTSARRAGAGSVLLGHARHVEGDEPQQTAEHKGDQGNHDQVRQFGAEELLAVGDPLVQHLAQEAAFLEPTPSHGKEELCGQEEGGIPKLLLLD